MDVAGEKQVMDDLLARIERLKVIDTHEHMTLERDFLAGRYDFTHLMSYVGLDLGLAGFPAEPWGASQWMVTLGDSVADKWQRIAPYWPCVRQSVYGREYRRLLRLFFGVDDLNERSAHEVSERIAEYQVPAIYERILRTQYNIQVMLEVHDHTPIAEPQYFAPVCEMDSLAGVYSAEELRGSLGQELPADFGDLRALLRQRLQQAAANGAAGLKIGMTARRRPLDFCAHPANVVQASYDALRAEDPGDWTSEPWRARLKPAQDALFWTAFGLAGELGLPVQVHSGLQFMQPWDGRPSALIPSLIRFPETRFLIFHGSYPHMAELTGLAKSFPNVYLDLAWFHLLSRHQARMWLAEWLDVLPHDKIMAFGGDAFLFFGVCSHLELARENVAAVLAERVVEGFCDLDEAEHTARLLFHDNARQVFRWV